MLERLFVEIIMSVKHHYDIYVEKRNEINSIYSGTILLQQTIVV